MATEPLPNLNDPVNASPPNEAGVSVDELKRVIERLRNELAIATADATKYREVAYAMLNERVPYQPPTEAELQDLLHGTRGQPLLKLIAQLEGDNNG